MSPPPSTNGDNGRDSRGRFLKGNKGGPGNPHAKRAATLRAMIFQAVSEDDLRAVISCLVRRAREGDIAAARELLDRIVGKPVDILAEKRLKLSQRRMSLAEERFEESLWDFD